MAVEMIRELPEDLRDELKSVRLVVMPRPNDLLVAEGVEPGEGGAYITRGEEPMPLDDGMAGDKQDRAIYLFGENLVPLTRETVQAVLLHEVAHACGLDEDEVKAALGLSRSQRASTTSRRASCAA
jgi:predicted Zn-dependent protease with MMP-like domain